MGTLKRTLLMVLASLALAACVTATTSGTKISLDGDRGRVALMPPDIILGEMTAGGIFSPHAEWTATAENGFGSALSATLKAKGIKEVVLLDGQNRSEIETQLVKLHEVVGLSIRAHQGESAFSLPSKGGKLDWTLGPDVAVLREKYKTDYALFVHLRDSYATAGRAAVIAVTAVLFGVGLPGGQQEGFASLVDLNTGQVLWFAQLRRGSGDMRTPPGVDETVKTLLTDFPV